MDHDLESTSLPSDQIAIIDAAVLRDPALKVEALGKRVLYRCEAIVAPPADLNHRILPFPSRAT